MSADKWPPPTVTDNPNEIVSGETRALNGDRRYIYTVVDVTSCHATRTMPFLGGTGDDDLQGVQSDLLLSRPGVEVAA